MCSGGVFSAGPGFVNEINKTGVTATLKNVRVSGVSVSGVLSGGIIPVADPSVVAHCEVHAIGGTGISTTTVTRGNEGTAMPAALSPWIGPKNLPRKPAMPDLLSRPNPPPGVGPQSAAQLLRNSTPAVLRKSILQNHEE